MAQADIPQAGVANCVELRVEAALDVLPAVNRHGILALTQF